MKTGLELFLETRTKLLSAHLILESSIETPTIIYTIDK